MSFDPSQIKVTRARPTMMSLGLGMARCSCRLPFHWKAELPTGKVFYYKCLRCDGKDHTR